MTDYIEQGNCLELMKDIQDNSVDMILCDLPYGTTRNKWDSVIPFEPLWEQYKRIIKDNGAIVLFGDGCFTAQLMLSNLKMWRYNLIWDKQRGCDFLNANVKPLKSHEDIVVFYKKKPTYNKQLWYSTPYKKQRMVVYQITMEVVGRHILNLQMVQEIRCQFFLLVGIQTVYTQRRSLLLC